MPFMNLGPLSDPSELNMGMLVSLSYMLSPESSLERSELVTTWTATGLGRIKAAEPYLVAAMQEGVREAKQRVLLKRDPEQIQRAEELSALFDVFAEMAPGYSCYEIQQKYFEPFGGFSAVARAPGLAAIMTAFERNWRQAMFAAAIWIINLQIYQHHNDIRPDGGGIRKAIHIMRHEPFWQDAPRDESTMLTYWRTYRSVAHLWAGFFYMVMALALELGPRSHQVIQDAVQKLFDEPQRFYQAAYLFGEFASNYRVGPSEQLIVDPNELWLMPPFPGQQAIGTLVMAPLSPAAQMALVGYKVKRDSAE